MVQDKIAEGEEEKLVDKILTLNEENGWAGVFTNLLKYQKDGVTPIEYTVAEEAVKGYNGTIAWKDGKWFITNELANTTVSITKQITGSMGDRSKEFYIYVTFDREVGDGEGYTVEGEGKNIAKFKLTDDGHVTIQNVPVDAKITGITETDVNGNVLDSGWKMNLWKPEIGEGNGVALPLDVDDTGLTLTIENNKEGTPDTGVLLDSLPYVLILGLVAVGAFFFLRKRRNDED